MWNGALNPRLHKSVAEHFDVVNIQANEILGIYYVTVVFHKTPNKQYVFEIDREDFEPDKESIGEEILRQLRTS